VPAAPVAALLRVMVNEPPSPAVTSFSPATKPAKFAPLKPTVSSRPTKRPSALAVTVSEARVIVAATGEGAARA